ncbi:MAG: hypothetical protein QXP49_06905 [Nitrososphaerota archaeon]
MSVWRQDIVLNLRALAGVEGKTPGEPPITSMGATNPPFVEKPQFILDHIVSDGAQVTRPSIDPYREPTETEILLFDSELRLSMPIILGGLIGCEPSHIPPLLLACFRMGVGVHLESGQPPSIQREIRRFVFLEDTSAASSTDRYGPLVIRVDDQKFQSVLEALHARFPESSQLVARLPCYSQPTIYVKIAHAGFKALIIDEDLGGDVPLELALSLADRALKADKIGDYPTRYMVGLIASGSRIRGSADIFKLGGLGADACIIKDAWRIAVDYRQDLAGRLLSERLENLLIGMQREIKLLMGAAGVSSYQSTIVGSRELFRALDLPHDILYKLGVKPAGE